MLSNRIFPTFPSEFLPENLSTLAYGPHGTVAIASGSIINFALISNHDKGSNNLNFKQTKSMFSISVGLNPITSLKFDTSNKISADPLLYIGDSAGNIFIYNYQKHEYLAVFSPNGHSKDDSYVYVQQIEIDFLPDFLDKISPENAKEGANPNKPFKNIIVLFKSKKIVSYSIYKESEISDIFSDKSITAASASSERIFLSEEDENNASNTSIDSGSYNNSFYKSKMSNSADSILTSLHFSVNWVVSLESEMSNFSIDPFNYRKIFLYNKNRDNSFVIINLEGNNSSFSSHNNKTENSNSKFVKPKIAFSSSLSKYDFKSARLNERDTFFQISIHRNSTIQCTQFSMHIQNHVYILTEHELMIYNIDLDLFTKVNFTNLTLPKSSHFDKIIQFESDHQKLLLVYKTGAMALLSLTSLFASSSDKMKKKEIKRRKRSVSDFFQSDNKPYKMAQFSPSSEKGTSHHEKPALLSNAVVINTKARASDDYDCKTSRPLLNDDDEEMKGNFSFKAVREVKQVQSQQYVNCVSPPIDSDRDDLLVLFYHPFGFALFDISRMKIVSCCPMFIDKIMCFSTSDKYVVYGMSQGNIRVRSIFDNSVFFSLHVLDEPIKFVSISNKSDTNEVNCINVYFGSDKKVGQFSFDTRNLSFFPSFSSLPVKKVIGSCKGGLIVQRSEDTISVFVKNDEVFLSVPDTDKIIDVCFNDNENDEDSSTGQDEKGSFMILRKNSIVELYRYNKYTKYSFTDNNYNCSSFNFLNDNSIKSNNNNQQTISPAATKRRIIAVINSNNANASNQSGKSKDKEKENKFVDSTCIALSGVDFALGFNDGSVFLLKTDDQTYAKRVEVLSSVPIIQMKYCYNQKSNRALFCLTEDQILCEVNLISNEITSKVTISHVGSFSIINSSFIMIKNETGDFCSVDPKNAALINSNNNNNSSISSKSNITNQNNNKANEKQANIYKPYEENLFYPFPVLSKYKKNRRKQNNSSIHDEEDQETEEDSSYTSFEDSLSFPLHKDILKEFILNNPIPHILKEPKPPNRIEMFEKRWFLFLPSIFDQSNKENFFNYLLNKNYFENKKVPLGRFGSPLNLPYSTEFGRDFWILLLERSSLRQECLYASSDKSLEYEIALSRILESVASLTTSANLNSSSHRHFRLSPQGPSPSLNDNPLQNPASSTQNSPNSPANSSSMNAVKFSMELFYSLVYAHRYDEATNALTYDPDSDNFMSNTILAAALLGFSEFDISSSSSHQESSSNQSSNNLPLTGSGENSNSIPVLNSDSSASSISLSMSAREQQYAVIKHAATQMIMLSTATGRMIEGANLLRLSQLDSFAASILIQAGQFTLAMKFIRGLKSKIKKRRRSSAAAQIPHNLPNSRKSKRITILDSSNGNIVVNDEIDDKSGFCFEIGAKCFKNKFFKEAAFFFITANEFLLAILSFFMFALEEFSSFPLNSPNDFFDVHYASAICDIYFLKTYLVDTELLNEPLLYEKDEVLKNKKLEKLGLSSPLMCVDKMVSEIDKEFKTQINHLHIDEKLFFESS